MSVSVHPVRACQLPQVTHSQSLLFFRRRPAAWIDINLMVTPATIGLLLQCINLPSPLTITIRSATADTLIETVGKGMPASDKLKLFEVLDVGTLLAALQEVGREGGKREAESEDVELLRTKLARLLNGVGTELCKIIDDVCLVPSCLPPSELA